MATVTVNDSNLYDIADSIRAKLGVQTTYKPSQMADAIDSISGGGITPTGELEITANGTYDVTNYASAEVDVPQSGITPTGTVSITQNGTVDVTQYASADVNVPTGSAPVINPLSVTANGTYTAPSGVDGYSPVTVNVPSSAPTGTKQISITANGTTTEDVSAYANAEITVNVPSSGHVFSALPVTIQNGRTGTIAVNRITYSYDGHPLFGFGRSNVSADASLTVQDMAYDGTYVFFNSGAGTSISYNGETATFERNGSNFMLQIPDNYDSSIPFIVT